jgi:cell division protein FtsZ
LTDDRTAAAVRAITTLVTGPPTFPAFDFAELVAVFTEGGPAIFGEGEAEGPDRAIRAADAAIADIRQQLSHRREETT